MPDPKKKLPDPSTSANDELFDATLRHQVGVRRMASGEVANLLTLLEKADQETVRKLRASLARSGSTSVNSRRLKALLRDIRDKRIKILKQLELTLVNDLEEFAINEADFELKMMQAALLVEVSMATVPEETLRSVVRTRPFAGGTNAARTLNQWFESLATADQARIVEAIQLGVIQGETVDDMVRRIAGTAKNKFADGILAVSRRQAETIVRTAVNHVSNEAREEVWDANEDIIGAMKWVSTLDGRTSAICRARDGQFARMGEKPLPKGAKEVQPPGARPPAHPNCRSVMVAVLDGEGLGVAVGERPFVRDTATGKKRQANFRKKAKEKVGKEKWKELTKEQRNALVKQEREKFGNKVVGQVPEDVTYDQWLKRQPADFQDDVLGKTKGALYRKGGLSMDQFVDRQGNELTVKELAKQDPGAFVKAGLNPDDF